MAALSWKKATSGNWTVAANWSPAKIPGASDDATIGIAGIYTVSLTSQVTVHSISLGDVDGVLSIAAPSKTETVTTGLTNAGTVALTGATTLKAGSLANGGTVVLGSGAAFDIAGNATNNGMVELAANVNGLGDAGTSSLTVGGKLTNNGDLNIGNSGLTKPVTVKAASFANAVQGTVSLVGGGGAGPATLDIGAAAPGTLTGAYYLQGNSLVEFKSGHVTTIASNSVLRLDGAQARVALAGSPGSSSALTSLTTNNGFFELEDHATIAVTAAGVFKNFGEIDVDTLGGGGSRLTIAGTLNNIGFLDIGGSSLVVGGAPALVTVGRLTSTGSIELEGGPGRATLDVRGAAFPTVTSSIELDADAVLEFGSGSITAIASGGDLDLNGAGAHVALRGNTATSGALAKLASNAGTLILNDGATLATKVGLANNGSLDIDPGFSGFFNDGGSSLAIGGTLTNNETAVIGNDGITTATNVSATALVNSGLLQITGSDNVQASLKVNAAAPATLTAGSYRLTGDALLQFTSGGIGAIGAFVTLSLDGAKSRVAVSKTPNSNSALTGLTSNAGTFDLEDGAKVGITAAKGLTNSSFLEVDQSGNGGSKLTASGVLTNSSALDIGNEDIIAATNVTAAKLVNTGTIDIDGGTSKQATLDIKAAAPSTLQNATYNLAGDALLAFGSGAVTAIGTNGRLSLDGAKSRVASGAATGSNSTLTKLAGNSGLFVLQNGALVTTTLGFVNSGLIQIDAFAPEVGGSSLAIGGTLTNGDNLSIGNSAISTGVNVSAKALANTGNIILTGGTARATLKIGAAAPATLTGTFSLSTNALLEFTGGAITAIGPNARLSLAGKKALVAVAGALTSDSALTKLASNAGTFDLEQGAALATKVGFANTDSLEIDGNNSFGGTSGGSSLTIGGALTNSNDVTIGNTGLTANTSVIATGALTNNPNATFTLTSGTAHATLKVGGALNNAGFLELDEFSGGNAGSGGSTLTVTGALTNSGTLQVGNGNITRATAATAAKLTNTGTIDLFGGIAANGGSARASLGIGAAAPSVWVGRAELSGNALLKFGSGTIQTIGSGANLSIDGAQAFVANAAKPTSNSALTGLTTNSGSFSLSDGATLALSAFDNSATLAVDGAFPTTSLGGSSLKLSGLLTNGGTLTIGNSSITKAATVTAAGLVNNGAVDLTGGTARATLNIGSPAPGNLSGSFDLEGNALLEFAGGGITTIGGGLTLDGAKALVALSSKLTSNSALSGLNTVSGTFDLEGGAALSLTGGLSNTGRLDVDTSFGQGGSSLTLGGTLITTNFFAIGNSNLSATTKVKVAVLTATGSINISGGIGANTNTATLSLTGASSDGGFMSIGGGGVLVLGSTLTVTSQLLLSGGTVSGGTLAGTGTLTGSQTSTLNHVTIAAGATFTAGFGSTLNDNGVTVNGAMKGGGSATLDFLNHGTLNVTNVSGFPTIGLANGGANNLVLTDANFTSTAGVITITDGDSGNTVDAHTLSSVNAIFVTAGTGTDKLTGGDGDDVFIAGGKTTMTGNAGTNQFRFLAAGSSNVIADFGGSASNELVFSNSGFNLGLSGAGATPQMMTPSEASTLFTANATGKFNNTSQRLAYSTATGKLFASADGSGSSAQLVATLTAHPSIAATQLFFIS